MKKKTNIGRTIGIIVGIMIILIPLGFFILWYLALSGQLDKKHSWDVRKYLEEKYEMTGEKITFVGKDRWLPYDRTWLIEPKNDYPDFLVNQEGVGWENRYLVDNLEDVRIADLYNEYEGSKESFHVRIVSERPYKELEQFDNNLYATARIMVEFCDLEGYRKCIREIADFSTFLSDYEISSYKVQIIIKDKPEDEKGFSFTPLYTGENNENFNTCIEKLMIEYAVKNGLWTWIEDIDDSLVEAACGKKTNADGKLLRDIVNEHREVVRAEEEYKESLRPYYYVSDIWNDFSKESNTLFYMVNTEGSAPFFLWNPDSGEALFSPGDELTLIGTASINEMGMIVFRCTETGGCYVLEPVDDHALQYVSDVSELLPRDYPLKSGTLFVKQVIEK